MNKEKISPKIVTLSFGVLVLLFLVSFYIFAWTEPTTAPPGGNVPAPLNVGSTSQYKTGKLGISTSGIDANYGLTVGAGIKVTNTGTQPTLYLEDQSSDPTPFIVTADGNVGIGTTGPGHKLEVRDANNGYFGFSAGDGGLEIGSGNDAISYIDFKGSANLGSDFQGRIRYTDGTGFAIEGGNVGIGTTAPGSTLVLRRSTAGTVFAVRNTGDTANNFTISDTGATYMTGFQLGTSATAGHVLTANASGVGTWQAIPGLSWPLLSTIDGSTAAPAYSWANDTNMGIRRGGADDLRFVTNGVDRIIINSAGQVGIGIDGSTAAPAYSWANDTNMGIRRGGADDLRFVTNGTDRIIINSSGQVGIGTTTIRDTLTLGGNIVPTTANTGQLGTSTYYWNQVNASAYYYRSDEILKTNIRPINNSLDKISNLSGVYFDWKDNGGKSIGILAQEVEKSFPEAVVIDKETGIKSVDYAKLIAPLIEAIKEQQSQIEDLKLEIEELKLKIR